MVELLSLNALQSVAIVLLALFLIAAGSVAAKNALSASSGRLEAESIAFRLARGIDSFYRNACTPGSQCNARFRVPVRVGKLWITPNCVTVESRGINASSSTVAPLSSARQYVYNASGETELVLGWDS